MSKARLVFRYEISDLFQLPVATVSTMRVNQRAEFKSFCNLIRWHACDWMLQKHCDVLGILFCASRKGGTGRGGWVYLKSANRMAASGRKYCRTYTGWVISPLLCMNWLRKQSSGHVGPPFLVVKRFSGSVQATIGQEL